MNESSTNTTFANRIGKSNIDLTLITSNLLRRISDWEISEEESNSYHNIINYAIRTDISHKNNTKMMGQKFIVNAENIEKYKGNIRSIVESRIREKSTETSEEDLDERLYKRIVKNNNAAQQIEEFSEAMILACEQSFKTTKAPRVPQKNKSVPWWTK